MSIDLGGHGDNRLWWAALLIVAGVMVCIVLGALLTLLAIKVVSALA